MWDTWTPSLSSSLDGKPSLTTVIRNRLQLQSELLPFSKKLLGVFLRRCFFGTGKSCRETKRLGIPPFSLALITAREEVVITTHPSLAKILR